MGKNRRSNGGNNTPSSIDSLLGSNLSNVDNLLNTIVDMDDDSLKELGDSLRNSVTLYLKQGDVNTSYYLLDNGQIIPQHKNSVDGENLLEDYDGDTYQVR